MSDYAGQSKASTAAAAAVAELDREIPLFGWDALYDDLPESELEAIFFQFDGNSDRELDKAELASSLFQLGYRIPKDKFDEVFKEFDADCGGTIDFEEFKTFIRRTGARPEKPVKFAMDLFKRYDVDTSGSIDKFEFAALASEVQASYRRRTLLTGLAAGLSAIAVGKYSEEYALAQKLFRGLYIEPKAEEAQKK